MDTAGLHEITNMSKMKLGLNADARIKGNSWDSLSSDDLQSEREVLLFIRAYVVDGGDQSFLEILGLHAIGSTEDNRA